jgi:hypothetical protein
LVCARLAFTAAKYGVGVGDPEVLAERERLCDALLGDGRTRTHAHAHTHTRESEAPPRFPSATLARAESGGR